MTLFLSEEKQKLPRNNRDVKALVLMCFPLTSTCVCVCVCECVCVCVCVSVCVSECVCVCE